MYPVHDKIHYATLTTTDSLVLERLGIDRGSLHCLPNSVAVPQSIAISKEDARAKVLRTLKLPRDARSFLYPVRGIRKKILVSYCYWHAGGAGNRYMGLTLKPASRMEARSYERWKCVAAEVSNRTVFDRGESSELNVLQNVLGADYVVSTSVAERFGMAFLEPWFLGRGVIARRLNTVTDDFEKCGVDLRSFYDSIPIPGNQSWIDKCRREI